MVAIQQVGVVAIQKIMEIDEEVVEVDAVVEGVVVGVAMAVVEENLVVMVILAVAKIMGNMVTYISFLAKFFNLKDVDYHSKV